MGTRIKIKRGTEDSIVANKDSLEQYEIVYAIDSGKLGIREDRSHDPLDTEDDIVWFIPKDTYYIEMGKGALSNGYSGVAIGENAYAGDRGIAIGTDASTAEDEIAIGMQAKVKTSAGGGVAIGKAAEINAGASKSIAIGQNAKANASNSISIGHEIVNNSANHVQLGNEDVLTGNIGDRPIDLQGAIQTVNLTIPVNGNGSSLNLNSLFSNKPIGTVGMFFFSGFLDSNEARGLRLMNNTTTPITSFHNTGDNGLTIFTFKIIKISATLLRVYAFVGEGFSSYNFTVNYNKPAQTITLSPSAIIQYAKGSQYDDETATLNIKFI